MTKNRKGRRTGINPPDVIEPSKVNRFPGVGKPNSNIAGWYKLFNDVLGSSFGDWNSWHLNRKGIKEALA